jgi:hypothetical protein
MGREIIVALGFAGGILIPINGYGQTVTSLSLPELLSTDPAPLPSGWKPSGLTPCQHRTESRFCERCPPKAK